MITELIALILIPLFYGKKNQNSLGSTPLNIKGSDSLSASLSAEPMEIPKDEPTN